MIEEARGSLAPLECPMIYSLFADLAVLLHFCFMLFVVLGGFLVLRWFRYVWLHIPAAVWGH